MVNFRSGRGLNIPGLSGGGTRNNNSQQGGGGNNLLANIPIIGDLV